MIGDWTIAGLTFCAAALSLLCAAAAFRHAGSPLRAWRRARLAAREDANGHALLRLAEEIEMHAAALHGLGQPYAAQQAWAALCRRIAVEHLACINALLLESGAGAGMLGEVRRTRDAGRDLRDRRDGHA